MVKKEDIFQFPEAKWVLPFFACHKDFCFRYVDLLAKTIGDYSFVKCVYGSPACKMNGGLLAREINEDEYLTEIDEWNKRGIPVWVTFSNYHITLREAAQDEQSQRILERLNMNGDTFGVENGVILANDTLYKFIKHTYPNLRLIASVIRQTLLDHPYNKKDYQSLEDKYDIICISHHHNNKVMEWAEELKDSADKYEIMMNVHCLHGCSFVKRCYEWQCRKSLGLEKTSEDMEIFKYCPVIRHIEDDLLVPQEIYTVLTYEETKHIIDKGFYNLKLAGRHLNLEALKVVAYGWMLNPNYRDIVERVLYEKHNKNDRKIIPGNLYFETNWTEKPKE